MSDKTNTSAVEVSQTSAPAAVGSRDKSVAWYKPTLENLPEQTKQLLRTYSLLSEDEMEAHIHKIRDEAWEIWPYPCIGQFRFLTLALPNTPSFSKIVRLLSEAPDARFLDLGCCFGQDLRALAAAGVPGEKLVGVELHGEFHDLGQKMFRDGGEVRNLGAKLVAADVFDLLNSGSEEDGETAGAAALRALVGRIDVLQASAFLHLFTREKQIKAGCAIVKLMKAGPGALVVGTQVGSQKPGLYEQGRMFLHDVENFEKLWVEIGERTGSEWRVEAVLAQDTRERKPAWDDGSVGKLNFEITRVR